MELNFHVLKSNRNILLPELVTQLERVEAYDQPDRVINLSDLRMNDDQNIVIPDQGNYALTPWSRRQIANLLGIRFDRWFENADNAEKAFEMNRRFDRAEAQVKLRTTALTADGINADGTLKAFLSPSFSVISDALLGNLLISTLKQSSEAIPVIRSRTTDKSSSYAIRIGEPHEPGVKDSVGTIYGGIQIINSGVGYSSLSISLHLTRLVCSNGMTAPIAGATLLRRKHIGNPEMQLWDNLSTVLQGIPEKLDTAVRMLRRSQDLKVSNPAKVIEDLIRQAKLPNKFIEQFQLAFIKEPHETAFGVSQSLTDFATHDRLNLSPEETSELENAAGTYLKDMLLM